jgi:hypothetical protein
MALIKIKTDSSTIGDTNGSYINASGIYDVEIDFVSVDVAPSGAESLTFNFLYNGSSMTVYNTWLKGKDGKYIESTVKLLTKLGIISGLGEDEDIEDPVPEEHAVGKDKTVKEFMVLEQFSGLPVKVHLQEEYSINPNKDEIQQRMVVKAFFREDGASAEEIINATEIGKRLALVQERYASNITYKDGLDVDAVAAWKAGKSSAKKDKAPKAKVNTANRASLGGSAFKR